MKPGSYRVPLAAGLASIGKKDLAKKIEDKTIKLAISHTLCHGVVTRPDLTNDLICALKTSEAVSCDEEAAAYYTDRLFTGSVVPVEDPVKVNHHRIYRPGELFFKS